MENNKWNEMNWIEKIQFTVLRNWLWLARAILDHLYRSRWNGESASWLYDFQFSKLCRPVLNVYHYHVSIWRFCCPKVWRVAHLLLTAPAVLVRTHAQTHPSHAYPLRPRQRYIKQPYANKPVAYRPMLVGDERKHHRHVQTHQSWYTPCLSEPTVNIAHLRRQVHCTSPHNCCRRRKRSHPCANATIAFLSHVHRRRCKVFHLCTNTYITDRTISIRNGGEHWTLAVLSPVRANFMHSGTPFWG